MENLNDIISGCKKKNDYDRKKLYDLFAPKLYTLCLRYAKDEDDAQDILHDGFVTIFNKISQFRSEGSFEGWVKRIMVNTALMKIRQKDSQLLRIDEYPNSDIELQESVLDSISAKELLSIINTLSEQYKLVFNLYAIEGYSHKEIAAMLNISEGTSKSNLARARKILQEKVIELTRGKETFTYEQQVS